MQVYNIYFENGYMYTTAGKNESDAIAELIKFYPHLAGADLLKVEPNGKTGDD